MAFAIFDGLFGSDDPVSPLSNPDAGTGTATEVCIVYNGEILETYPARIKTVFAIYLLDENGEAIIEKDSD